jgi:hypothetical protein
MTACYFCGLTIKEGIPHYTIEEFNICTKCHKICGGTAQIIHHIQTKRKSKSGTHYEMSSMR